MDRSEQAARLRVRRRAPRRSGTRVERRPVVPGKRKPLEQVAETVVALRLFPVMNVIAVRAWKLHFPPVITLDRLADRGRCGNWLFSRGSRRSGRSVVLVTTQEVHQHVDRRPLRLRAVMNVIEPELRKHGRRSLRHITYTDHRQRPSSLTEARTYTPRRCFFQ